MSDELNNIMRYGNGTYNSYRLVYIPPLFLSTKAAFVQL